MLRINKDQLPCDATALAAALQRYKDALVAHAQTEGVSAPWPEYDILFAVMNAGGNFEVVEPPPTPEPSTDTGFSFTDLVTMLKAKSVITDADINAVITAKMLPPTPG